MIYGGDVNTTQSYVIDYRNKQTMPLSTKLPGLGRFYHSVIEFEDKLYLFGGQDSFKFSKKLFSDFYLKSKF